MTTPLSRDLRRRIVERDSSVCQAAARYEVSPSAAVKLMRRLRESGSVRGERSGANADRCLSSLRAANPGGDQVQHHAA
jgi:putative transposase